MVAEETMHAVKLRGYSVEPGVYRAQRSFGRGLDSEALQCLW
jgi:hypothetical protein